MDFTTLLYTTSAQQAERPANNTTAQPRPYKGRHRRPAPPANTRRNA